MNEVIKKSITQTNVAINKQVTMTTIVDSFNCCFEGHETFFISLETSPEYCLIFAIIKFLWHLLAVARAVGLEPTTYGFGDRCSTDWATPVNAVNACKELMNGIEPSTSSLPRKCSTNWATSAFMQNIGTAMIRLSGRRDSNSRPTAWKAVTLPTELLPHFYKAFAWAGKDSNLRRRSRQIYSLLHLTALVPALYNAETTKLRIVLKLTRVKKKKNCPVLSKLSKNSALS